MVGRLSLFVVALLGLVVTTLALPAYADESPANVTPPTVVGTPQVGLRLTATPGTWDPADAKLSFRWLRGGVPIPGATGRTYRPVAADRGRYVAVRVTAGTTAVRSAAKRVKWGRLGLTRGVRVTGARKYLSTLTAGTPTFRVRPTTYVWRWLRDGRPIPGATRRTYQLGWRDVGHKVRVRVVAKRAGYANRPVHSVASPIQHRVPARHVVHYHVETRGALSTSVRDFRVLANASLNDPRGWRGAGIAFREVRSGGSMTLVLAESSWLPRFSSGCSAQWSCRVGRYVIINQLRWKHASPAWNRAGGSLRNYRHMVVNHETGHWLGWGHRSCPRPGAAAPVMQQQSIGLQGCRFNPFPTAAERNVPRF